MEMINPLRGGAKGKALPPQTSPERPSEPKAEPKAEPTPEKPAAAVSAPVQAPAERRPAPAPQKAVVDLPKADLTDPTLLHALAVLEARGIKIAEPKLKWVKHSFEIEEEAFELFQEMVPELGYRTVKEAITEAVKEWSGKRQDEFKRRKFSKGK